MSAPVRRFDLVLLDMDGVLTDTTPCHRRAYDELWAHLQIAGPPYAQIAGRRTDEVVAEVTSGRDPGAQELAGWVAFKRDRALRHLRQVAPFPDVLPALERLHRDRRRLAVGTSASRASAAQALQPLTQHIDFDCIVTGDDVACGKPAPEIFLTVMHRCGIPPRRTLVVEDSAPGLQAAAAAGAWHLSVRSGVRGAGPDFLGAFDDLAAVAAWVTGAAS